MARSHAEAPPVRAPLPYSACVRPDVLVDARNVLRSQWPNIPEALLVELACRWARENGVRAVLVFDGEAPGGVRGEHPRDADCILVGTGIEIADDAIARAAAELGARGEAYWLVTSDRELRRRAGGDAEQVIGGGSFARTLQALG